MTKFEMAVERIAAAIETLTPSDNVTLRNHHRTEAAAALHRLGLIPEQFSEPSEEVDPFNALAGALLPENDDRAHLDVAQNFRLKLQDMHREEFGDLLDTLKTPSGDCTLREELDEWAGLLYWKGFLRRYQAKSPLERADG